MRKISKNVKSSVKSSVAAIAVPAKPVAAKAVKAATVAKPATPKTDTARTERVAIFGENRTNAARFYAGASSVIHKANAGKLDQYKSRVLSPVQACSNGNRTERDTSLNVVLHSESNSKTRSFDPVLLGCDLGAISRLASVGAIAYSDADGFTVTEAGASYARAALASEAKRLAAIGQPA